MPWNWDKEWIDGRVYWMAPRLWMVTARSRELWSCQKMEKM